MTATQTITPPNVSRDEVRADRADRICRASNASERPRLTVVPEAADRANNGSALCSPSWKVIEGDCILVMQKLPEDIFDSAVLDGPYGIEWMGHAWDTFNETGTQSETWDEGRDTPFARKAAPRYGGKKLGNKAASGRAFQQFTEEWGRELYRVLKPGGYALSFCGTRTYHRMVCALEDVGFEIRDTITWHHGQGMPKSRNIGHAFGHASKTELGTALKPATELIVVARKPLVGTVERNVREHGTGALNIDAARIAGAKPACVNTPLNSWRTLEGRSDRQQPEQTYNPDEGRWPANVIWDRETARILDAETGVLAAGNRPARRNVASVLNANSRQQGASTPGRTDAGGASRYFKVIDEGAGDVADRGAGQSPAAEPGVKHLPIEGPETLLFKYCAKPGKRERDAGLEHLDEKPHVQWQTGNGASGKPSSLSAGRDTRRRNTHNTVKPVELMRYLVKLVTPAGGTVLDPFAGSGSTGCAVGAENADPDRAPGWSFVGIEREAPYVEIARARIAHWWGEEVAGDDVEERAA
jgi:site-specific DNA-methyltransferase (adenine-specific)